MPSPPQLLVSVRNRSEARLAADAGVHVIDIKEPAHGSLGRAENAVISEIVDDVRARGDSRVSAAFGELCDVDSAAPPPPVALSLLKIGLANLRDRADWAEEWSSLRTRWNQSWPGTASPPSWVAVAYVDELAAQAPPPAEVVRAAMETGCAGVLFDTFEKSRGRLFDYLSRSRLAELVEQLHARRLWVAAAGRLQLSDLPPLCALGVDIIAVRSAACTGSQRQSALDPSAIRRLLQEIQHSSIGFERTSSM